MSQDADALERAIALACRAHRGQRYPSPEAEPYILHPLRVMFAVQGFKAQTAAVLHDVLEDTEVNVDQLRQADSRRCHRGRGRSDAPGSTPTTSTSSRWHTIVLPAT